MIRSLIKFILETGTEFQLLQHFEAMPVEVTANGETEYVAVESGTSTKIIDGTKFDAFLEALFNIIVVIPVK